MLACGAELDRVVEQVEHQLTERRLVGEHLDALGDLGVEDRAP